MPVTKFTHRLIAKKHRASAAAVNFDIN